MRFAWGFLAAALAAGAAHADTPGLSRPGAAIPAKPPSSAPASVWVIDDDQSAEHLESGLLCRRAVDDYRRIELHVYDPYGFDVSCNFGAPGTLLTLYVTRVQPGFDAAGNYASAKEAIVKASPQRHPMLLTEDKPGTGGFAWSRAIYVEDNDAHTALWLTMLAPDWAFEFRATYPASQEGLVNVALTNLVRGAAATAGARIKLCAAAPKPPRWGQAVKDAGVSRDEALMSSLLGGAVAAGADKDKSPTDPASVVWCPETTAQKNGIPLLFWRGVTAAGADAGVDRVTAMTIGPPPELDIALDGLANLVEAEAGRKKGALAPERWTASTHHGTETIIYGYFDGRPDPDAVTSLFADILRGKLKPIGGYDADGGNITIRMPPPN